MGGGFKEKGACRYNSKRRKISYSLAASDDGSSGGGEREEEDAAMCRAAAELRGALDDIARLQMSRMAYV